MAPPRPGLSLRNSAAFRRPSPRTISGDVHLPAQPPPIPMGWSRPPKYKRESAELDAVWRLGCGHSARRRPRERLPAEAELMFRADPASDPKRIAVAQSANDDASTNARVCSNPEYSRRDANVLKQRRSDDRTIGRPCCRCRCHRGRGACPRGGAEPQQGCAAPPCHARPHGLITGCYRSQICRPSGRPTCRIIRKDNVNCF